MKKQKVKKIKPFSLWAIKRRDSDEVYVIDSFYWTEYDAVRAIRESTHGGYRYRPEEEFEVVRLKISQV